jgi:PDZ domain/PA domain
MRTRRLILLICLAAFCCAAGAAPDSMPAISLGNRFAIAGLRVLPDANEFDQSFDLNLPRRPMSDCRLTIAGRRLRLDRDYRPLGASAEGSFSGPVVFAGRGISNPANGMDDYARIDARGKIVLAIQSDPPNPQAKIQAAARHGAKGLLLFSAATGAAAAHDAAADSLAAFDANTPVPTDSLPAMQITRSLAELILGPGWQLRFDSSGDAAASSASLGSAAGTVHVQPTQIHFRCVAGCVPGAGPDAKAMVIVTADPSAAAPLLKLAAAVALAPAPPRTIVFALCEDPRPSAFDPAYFPADSLLKSHSVAAVLNLGGDARKDTSVIYASAALPQPPALPPPWQFQSLPAPLRRQIPPALDQIPVVLLPCGPAAQEPPDIARQLVGILCTTTASNGPPAAPLGVIPDDAANAAKLGVLVQGVRPGSAAADAGLQGGDLILQFNGQKIATGQDLARCLANARAGDKVTLQVQRGGGTLLLHATLQARGR